MNRFTLPLRSRGAAGRPRTVRFGAVALVAASATTLAACGGSGGGGGSSQSDSDTVTIAFDADAAPNGYDPLLYGQRQFEFFSSMYDSLFVTSADGTIEPSLATGFTNNADNTQTTLTLQQGVTFSDGSTLDSALVKANLDRRSDTELAAYNTFAAGGSTEITDVATPDAQTVVITWASAQASPDQNLVDHTGTIVGADAVADPDSLATTPDGSGPYTLDDSTRGSSYTLTKNDEAWNADSFAFDTLVFKVITDDQALANAVTSGQADVALQLEGSTVDQVSSQREIVRAGGTVVGFPVADKLGTTNPAFGEVGVRQALMYGLDRESLVNDLHPASRATAQMFPESATGFDEAIDEEYAYDPDKARDLLAAAGYPDGFSFDITVLGQPTEDQVAVQQQWQQIGVTMNFITATSTDAVFAAAMTEPMLFGPFAIGANPAGFSAGVLVGGFMNLQKASDPAIEGSLGAALGATGDAQAAALTELNAAIADRVWFVPLYEDFIYLGYDSDKVAEPSFAGTSGRLDLSSISPVT